MATRTLALLALLVLAVSAKDWHTVTCNDNFVCTIAKGKNTQSGTAWAIFHDDMETTGWTRLTVKTNPNEPNARLALFAAGWVEGYLTAMRIFESYINYMQSTFANQPSPQLLDFMGANFNWTLAQVASINYTDPQETFEWQYWAQVGLVMAQVEGITLGYTVYAETNPSQSLEMLNMFDIYLLNSDGDMDDLVPAMNLRAAGRTRADCDLSPARLRELQLGSHCSSITKFTGTQLYAAHEMWSTYSQMLPVYKVYEFKTPLSSLVSEVVSMSSYPAYVSSEDDFYLLSSGLQVMETTNSVINMTLYDLLEPETLLSWVRAMVANRMANSGMEWTQIITPHNSGTYNNQWIVVDHKLFKAGQPIAPNTLWIAEQIPGQVVSGDVSNVLASQGYWPSYNVAFFPEIFAAMGYPSAVAQFGNVWSYASNPRANIMRAYHTNITDDISTVQNFMRYNDWQTDPLQLGCSMFGLASRGDLAPTQQKPIWGGICGHAAFGAINAKISSSSLIGDFSAYIISGPTTNGQPPFSWSSPLGAQNSHLGQPETFDFGWINVHGSDS